MESNNANRNRHKRSNFTPVATHLLNSTSKGIKKTAKWIATDHSRSSEFGSVTESLQRLNYLSARLASNNRQFERSMKQGSLIPSRSEIVWDWLIDHLLFAGDILWGFLKPILKNIFYGLLRLFAIILVNVIFFYALFKLISL